MKYNFNKSDLLRKKESYMYSEFHGKNFLRDYKRSRINFLKKLNSKNFKKKTDYFFDLVNFINRKINYKEDKELIIIFNILKKNPNLNSNKLQYLSLLDISKKLVIETNELLNSLIILSIQKKEVSKINTFLEKLINKFEVSKRLYISYSKDFKKIGRKNKVIELYVKFSLLLTIEYIKKPSVRYLSTLLKVNDLISSSKSSLNEIFHDELEIIFNLEKYFIKKLAKKNGINL